MSIDIDSDFVKKLRKKQRLNQSELADLIGVSTRTIQNWEGKKRNIPEWAKLTLQNIEKGIYLKQNEIEDELTAEEVNILSNLILLKEDKIMKLSFFEKWLKEKLLKAKVEAVEKYKNEN